MTIFSDQQLKRYSRHISLDDVGAGGQAKIIAGKVLIVGAGGLGSSAALHLAAAGVGTIGLVDDDRVDLSNLQRQIIHATPDIGKLKILSANEKITKINPDINVVTYCQRVKPDNIGRIIGDQDYDFIIDATDNFTSKFLINDAAVLMGKPFSHGGVLRFEGQTITYTPGSACYRCVFECAPPPDKILSCLQVGVFGAVPGVLGTIQAAEALKYLIGSGGLLTNRLLIVDLGSMCFRDVTVRKNAECPACGENSDIAKVCGDEQRKGCFYE